MKIVIAFQLLGLLLLVPGSPSADQGEALPISCLYRQFSHEGGDHSKSVLTSRLEGRAIYPALQEKFKGAPADSMPVLTILLRWFDYPSFTGGTPFTYESFLNEKLRAYYLEVSQNRFHLNPTVTVWLQPDQMYHYFINSDQTTGTSDDYGFNTSEDAFTFDPPMNVWGLARAAIRKADEAGVDFTLFDNDGPDGIPSSGDDDGVVDAIIIIHAGRGAERAADAGGADLIWSHKSDLNDPIVISAMGETSADGVKIGPYLFVPENGNLGVFAHEFGHILGLPDLYGTFNEEGSTVQLSLVGAFCLMDAGGLMPLLAQPGGIAPGSMPTHINPVFKEWLGWLEPALFSRDDLANTNLPGRELAPVVSSGEAMRLLNNPGGVDWDNQDGEGGEYFLLEYRTPRIGTETYLPEEGLLIWHTNELHSNNNSRSPSGRLLSLVPSSSGGSTIGTTDLGSEKDVWPNGSKVDWTPGSNPSTSLYSGAYTGISLREIDISPGGSTLSFDLDLLEEPVGELSVFPNPYRPDRDDQLTILFRPAGSGTEMENESDQLDILVFDMTGAPVRSLPVDPISVTDWTASWDGKNDAGNEAASGVYLLIVRGGQETVTGKIALVR